jgi:hypothetical protein
MRAWASTGAVLWVACASVSLAQSNADAPISPIIELQSEALTPGLVLDESPRPIHQVRLLVDAKLDRGVLVLDGNPPEFDEFGGLTGGIQTPQDGSAGDPRLMALFDCRIEPLKAGPDDWRLFRVSGSKLRTPLRIATRGPIAAGGPSRLIVLGPDDKVKAVVECTRYGLVVP